MKTAREGKTSYRLRHRRAIDSGLNKPLMIPGYGVELALKRTDYIVIDDRKDDDEEAPKSKTETKVKFGKFDHTFSQRIGDEDSMRMNWPSSSKD